MLLFEWKWRRKKLIWLYLYLADTFFQSDLEQRKQTKIYIHAFSIHAFYPIEETNKKAIKLNKNLFTFKHFPDKRTNKQEFTFVHLVETFIQEETNEQTNIKV